MDLLVKVNRIYYYFKLQLISRPIYFQALKLSCKISAFKLEMLRSDKGYAHLVTVHVPINATLAFQRQQIRPLPPGAL